MCARMMLIMIDKTVSDGEQHSTSIHHESIRREMELCLIFMNCEHILDGGAD